MPDYGVWGCYPDPGLEPELVEFVARLHGSSQPSLMRASDGAMYVVKFAHDSQPDHLFNESAGSELYRWLGLPVPDWQLLRFSDAFLDANPGCHIRTWNGLSRPSGRLAFGSRYLGDHGARLLEILPGTSISRIENAMSFWVAWMADICALHNDNRQVVFQEDANRSLRAFFVDHGNLFGVPGNQPDRLFAASRYLDSRVYPELRSQGKSFLLAHFANLNEDLLWSRIRQLPEELRTATGLFRLKQTVDRLKNRAFLKNILATITGSDRIPVWQRPRPVGLQVAQQDSAA